MQPAPRTVQRWLKEPCRALFRAWLGACGVGRPGHIELNHLLDATRGLHGAWIARCGARWRIHCGARSPAEASSALF